MFVVGELGDLCLEVNSNLFYCPDRYIIAFSLCRIRWFDRTTVLGVQCCSRCGSLSFHDFGLKTADVTLLEAYNRTECFLLHVLTDLFYLLLKILALYCRVSGQVPLSVYLFKDLIAPSAWLILYSADRPWLRFWFCVDGLWWRRFWYCSDLGSLVPL